MLAVEVLAKAALQRISNLLGGCLLYLDAGAGELIASTVGLRYLLDLGVVHVCSVEASSARDAAAYYLLSGQRSYSVVVICTQLLTKAHVSLLRLHQANEEATSCTIFCSYSEAAHSSQPDTMLGSNAYAAYLAALQEDLQDTRRKRGEKEHPQTGFQTTIQHLHLHACTFDSRAFVLPAASSAVASARIGQSAAGIAGQQDLGDDGLDAPSAVGLKLLAHAIMDIASELNVRLDTFSLGQVANMIGDEICSMSAPATATETAALVLVDRSLDIVTPLSHADHLVDQIYGVLPRRGHASNPGCRPSDVVVALPAYFGGALSNTPPEAEMGQKKTISKGLGTGSLYLPADQQMAQWREFLLSRSGNDAALFLRKWLREALRKAGISTKMRFKTGSVSVEEFSALAWLLAAAPPQVHLKQLSILQLAFGAAAALRGRKHAAWEALAKAERELISLSANGMEEELQEKVCAMLRHATSTSGADIGLEDALGLAWVGLALSHEASILGGGSSDLRASVAGALVDAVMEGNVRPESIGLDEGLSDRLAEAHASSAGADGEYESQAIRLEVSDRVLELLEAMDTSAAARSKLKQMRRYLEHGAGSKGTSCLLAQLVQPIVEQQPIQDLHHNTASIGGLLKSGLGRFGLVHKQPQPGNHSTVIVFVVGGLSVAEIREVRQVVGEMASSQTDRAPVNVLLGGTTLMSPQDVVKGLFR